ncbi:MAG: hypothetical protein KDI09_19385 [Halioglobus sp.]|nr:hypothetical protein [Halioglobus sp.]
MRILKSGSLLLVPLLSLLILAAPAASAHGPGYDHYRPHSYRPQFHGQSHAYVHRLAVPVWLQGNYDFLRWYNLNPYLAAEETSWRHVYRRYQRDHRYHRRYRSYQSADYRDYRKGGGKPAKRRHH